MTEDELLKIEERHSIEFTNWMNCEMVLRAHRYPTIHVDHQHHPRTGKITGMPDHWAVRMDLMHNRCAEVLGKAYIRY